MAENLLKNGGFEADWGEESNHRVLVFPTDGAPYETELDKSRTPPGWVLWFYHGPGNWDQPEVGDIRKEHVSYRVHAGEKAARLSTFYRKHDAGLMQQVQVESGQKLRVTAWAHAWSNHPLQGHEDCTDDPHCSCGVGRRAVFLMEEDIPPLNGDAWNDAIGNISFMLGIDPTGGTDPWANSVVWGPTVYVYNRYHEVPAVEAVATSETVTIFLRSKTLWAFKHNDAYWDAVELVAVEDSPPPEPEPEPESTEWDYPVIGKGSKIGVHAIHANNVPAFARDLRNNGARFPVVKAVDDLGWIEEIKAVSPDTMTIGRFTSGRESCGGLMDRDLGAMAESLIDIILERKGDRECDYWEVVNEPDPLGPEGYRRLALLMIECMTLAERHDLKLALFSLCAGTPEWDEMEAMVETGVFGRARQGGHILALHEGTIRTQDPKHLWGHTIPGSPEVEGAGAMNFRYRYLYYLLKQRDEVVPLVLSEWYCGNEDAADPAWLLDALLWYDSEASKDYYVWAVCPFTLGPTQEWGHTDYEGVYPALVDHIVAIKDRQNALLPEEEPDEPMEPGSPECVPPRVSYRRSYNLLPQTEDPLERLDWRTAVAIGSSDKMETIGHSADDAGVGPPARRVTVINPMEQREDLRAWYEERYPGVLYREIEASTPWEAALHLLPDLRGDIALGQNDPRWRSYDFGEEPGGGTMGRYGGLLTGLTVILRNIYGRDVTPVHLDKLLVAARAAFVEGRKLLWKNAVGLFSAFDDGLKDDNQRSVEELEALWDEGWEVILGQVDDQAPQVEHFVYLERIVNGVLHIIDTRDGERKQKAADGYINSLKGIRAAHLKQMPVTPSFELLGEGIDLGEWVCPSEPYDRTYVLLPQIEDLVDRLEWRMAAAVGSSHDMETFGHSADDAGIGPPKQRIIAVNPDCWEGDLEAWYGEHYRSPRYGGIEAETPWEMAIGTLPMLEEDIALSQNDWRWADYDFGEHPDVGGETIGRYGCFLTGLSMILRRIYRRDVTPPVLDKLLVAARSAYFSDNYLAWDGAVPLFSVFDNRIRDNDRRSASELKQMLDTNWEVILRRADGGHFVYLEDVQGESLLIIDTWDGRRKRKVAGDYAGIRAAHVKEGAAPPTPRLLVGQHDESGGEWMVDHGLRGCCLVHGQVQRQSVQLDFRHLQKAGIVVIARLNWGYADGTGTFPRPQDRESFVNAVVDTMLAARGVDFFYVGNEPNNRREWPGSGSQGFFALTPQYVTRIYNDIWDRVDGRTRMGPPPIDPYFGPGSNNREWWTYILEHIKGADALFLHCKTQTNDPAEVWSKAKFTHWPLEWQYLHLRTAETSLEVVPDRFRQLPVFVTELNPHNLDDAGGIGWRAGNDVWVHEAARYFREVQPVAGIMFYRYDEAGDQAAFGLEHKPIIRAAIEEEARLEPVPAVANIGSAPRGLPLPMWRRVVEAYT